MIIEATEKLARRENLSTEEMQMVMEEIMSGQAQTEYIVAFLERLSEKTETVEEITAAAKVMRAHAIKVKVDKEIILDTCGTGGDCKGTFNVSTISAFVIAGCDITVAKHGNRSVSSSCGSADILEAVGVNISAPKENIEHCLQQIGIAFLFAPLFHPAVKYAMPARKQIGRRTIFNILGPLCNPANTTHQVIGVFDAHYVPILAQVAGNLGIKRVMVVHGKDGLDEITLTDTTEVAEFINGELSVYQITPEEFGFRRVNLEDLEGGDINDNVQIMLEVLNGKSGVYRDMTVFNAAAALYVAGKAQSIRDAIALAIDSIDSGRALKKLALLKQLSHERI
ncbi:MAG: anthranilate phosphoribosyltransferase [Candidatus Omnitrophica bacterium]|nr:anthranilate phosphoribosyltransferase [Candidatus Omnitrophota bacterium]